MYRAVALAGLRRGVDWGQPDELAEVAREIDLRVVDERIFLDGEDVTQAVRTSEVTAITRYAADNPSVRRRLVALQRSAAVGQNIVTEGRDQGTVAFPEAQCKIFLTASPEERARRRVLDLQAQGETADFEAVLAAQKRRDQEDASRQFGPLVPAADAVEVSTDGLSLKATVDRLEQIVQQKGQ